MFDRRELAAGILIAAIFLSVFAVAARADEGPAEDPADLTARALAWVATRPDGAHRLRDRRAFDESSRVIQAAWLIESKVPAWPDAELLLALSWREARWMLHLRSRDGALGPVQIMPRLAPRQDLRNPTVSFAVAAGFLSRGRAECGSEGRALRKYAAGECGPPRHADRRVLRWAEQIRRQAYEAPLAQETGSWSARGAL